MNPLVTASELRKLLFGCGPLSPFPPYIETLSPIDNATPSHLTPPPRVCLPPPREARALLGGPLPVPPSCVIVMRWWRVPQPSAVPRSETSSPSLRTALAVWSRRWSTRSCYLRSAHMRAPRLILILRRGCLLRGCIIRSCLRRGCILRGCIRRGCLLRGCLRRGCILRGFLLRSSLL